jgi:hypothetical protein
MPLLQFETRAGEPIRVGKTQIVPYAKVLHIPFPGMRGGIIWNRPLAVGVQEPEQEERIIPVPDVTRQAQLTLLGISLVCAVLIGLLLSGKKKST